MCCQNNTDASLLDYEPIYYDPVLKSYVYVATLRGCSLRQKICISITKEDIQILKEINNA